MAKKKHGLLIIILLFGAVFFLTLAWLDTSRSIFGLMGR